MDNKPPSPRPAGRLSGDAACNGMTVAPLRKSSSLRRDSGSNEFMNRFWKISKIYERNPSAVAIKEREATDLSPPFPDSVPISVDYCEQYNSCKLAFEVGAKLD